MEYTEHITAVEGAVPLIADALRAAPRTAPVPTCPEWTLAELAAHVGEFSALWTHMLCEATGRTKTPYAPLSEADDPATWFEPIGNHLVDELRAATGDTPCWTWMPDQQHAGCVARRTANELAIHRYDAQSASGATTPLDAVVAGDAIDEIFVMIPAWGNPPDASGHTVHVHGVEGGEWTITLGAEGPRVAHAHAPADLTLTGTASDLALLLFHRPAIGTVERDGDPAALGAWYRDFLFD